MIDIHTHLLYDVDDGSDQIQESIELLKKATENNITDIILTPHYIKNTKFSVNNKEKQKKLTELKKELKKREIKINLYLGNEIYIHENIMETLHDEAMTLNNSRYILIELPKNGDYLFLNEVLYNLKKHNLIPIIAHPERYTGYYKNYDFFNNLIKNGCLLQGNIGSLYGIYGRKSKKMLKELLKRKMIHFLGSDIHHNKNNFYHKKHEKKLNRLVKNRSVVEDILYNNAKKILENKPWSEPK